LENVLVAVRSGKLNAVVCHIALTPYPALFVIRLFVINVLGGTYWFEKSPTRSAALSGVFTSRQLFEMMPLAAPA
jgi:hypothetical protein